MKKLLLLFITQTVFTTAGLAQQATAEVNEEAAICRFDPYTVKASPVTLPDSLVREEVYGNIILYVHIDTTTDEIAKVLIVRADLKRKEDDSNYLFYQMDADFDKVETYPERLREIYPFLVDYAKDIEIKKVLSTAGWGRYVAYTIPVKVEK